MVAKGVYERVRLWLNGLEGRLLNLGCDHGEESNWLPAEKFEIHNVDIVDRDRPNFTRQNLNDPWSLRSDYYDVVVAVELIEHLENPWHFLREVKRVLKVEGTGIITTPNIISQPDREMFLKEGHFRWFRPHDIGIGGHINPIPQWELLFILQQLGLKVGMSTTAGENEEVFLVEFRKPWWA